MKKKMIHCIEWNNHKPIDKGCVPMTKREIKCFEDFEKRQKAGKEISYSFEPLSLMSKLSIHTKKDRRGNVHVDIREPKKGECHHYQCHNKVVHEYILCRKHLKGKFK